jgi:hypothetical protein
MTYFPKIVIICPPSIKANWGTTAIADLFTGNNLELRIQPDTYTRVEEGTQSTFNDFFDGVGYNQSPVRIGFNIAIQDKRDELALAIKELSKLSLGTKYTDFQTVTVWDYLRPENAADYQAGYAIRVGKIWIENLTATVQKGNLICATPHPIEQPQAGRYNSGFNLKFMSAKKQVVN